MKRIVLLCAALLCLSAAAALADTPLRNGDKTEHVLVIKCDKGFSTEVDVEPGVTLVLEPHQFAGGGCSVAVKGGSQGWVGVSNGQGYEIDSDGDLVRLK